MNSFLKIRNIGVKTALMVLGLTLVFISVYHSSLWALLLTEKKPEKEVYWSLLIIGFFLATGAAFYNTMADAIVIGVKKIIDKYTTK